MKQKPKQQKYRITLTEHQLSLMAQCVEDCHRFMAGEMDLANSTCMVDDMHELHEEMRKLQHLVTPGLCRGSAYGWSGATCPNEYQRRFIAETYYLYREIYHQMTINREIPVYSCYNSHTLTCEDSGEPIIIEKL